LKAEQPVLDARRLVFIDETAVTTKMIRHYGRSPRGKRLVAYVPHGHWKTLTLTAPYVVDGAMDGPSFLAYVEQVLAPTLRKGGIVFMENLRTHKIEGVREAIEAAGATVRYFRSPCSSSVCPTGVSKTG
jgi:DDE superfamily endonuclease